MRQIAFLRQRLATVQCSAASSSGSGDSSSEPAPEDSELGDASDDDGEKSRVIFRMEHGVAFGERLKVVGDGPVLGDWDITQAPSEHWPMLFLMSSPS